MKKKLIIATILIIVVVSVSYLLYLQQSKTLYNSESWKTMIPATCTRWYDGCNWCSKNGITEKGIKIDGTCTMKGCRVYEKPICMDAIYKDWSGPDGIIMK